MTEKQNNPGERLPYEAPRIEVFEYAVERGFADTYRRAEGHNIETVSEITDNSGLDGGENFHGEWY
ncbi:MAG: hypothetical protein K5864_09580 [Bacteroidales bacterium]|nr:hypothetical protein [Bacteroidales bacterium]